MTFPDQVCKLFSGNVRIEGSTAFCDYATVYDRGNHYEVILSDFYARGTGSTVKEAFDAADDERHRLASEYGVRSTGWID